MSIYPEGTDLSTTQDVVPELISKLYKANMELETSSSAPTILSKHDPHLRLRRTLTPASPIKGIDKYNEAQFMIEGSAGKRETLRFSALGHEFLMDAYVFGADDATAKRRMFAFHGISPGASRARWHPLGDRLQRDDNLKDVRFVALDWHSIDRTDTPQDAFLTMLPKHFWTNPDRQMLDEITKDMDNIVVERLHKMLSKMDAAGCPRGFAEASQVLYGIITEGLGWGLSADKPIIPCLKSWSGGVGMHMLANHHDLHIDGAIIMHAAALDKNDIVAAIQKINPVLLCWAKDDPLVPYGLSDFYLIHSNVERVTYEKGGHANFNGDGGLPNFDDEIVRWLKNL